LKKGFQGGNPVGSFREGRDQPCLGRRALTINPSPSGARLHRPKRRSCARRSRLRRAVLRKI